MTDLIAETLATVERCYDAIPRVAGARVESVGPFELFLRSGLGWPFYARPRLGTDGVSVEQVDAVRGRQRELGVPEAIEWVHDLVPLLLAAVARSARAGQSRSRVDLGLPWRPWQPRKTTVYSQATRGVGSSRGRRWWRRGRARRAASRPSATSRAADGEPALRLQHQAEPAGRRGRPGPPGPGGRRCTASRA